MIGAAMAPRFRPVGRRRRDWSWPRRRRAYAVGIGQTDL